MAEGRYTAFLNWDALVGLRLGLYSLLRSSAFFEDASVESNWCDRFAGVERRIGYCEITVIPDSGNHTSDLGADRRIVYHPGADRLDLYATRGEIGDAYSALRVLGKRYGKSEAVIAGSLRVVLVRGGSALSRTAFPADGGAPGS